MFLSDPRETNITFGQPASNDPFSFKLRDLFTLDADTLEGFSKISGPDWAEQNRMAEKFSAGVIAAERQTRLVDTINARENALAEAADHRIRTVRERTGIGLENPFRGGYELDARERLAVPLTGASPIELSRLTAAQRDIFNEKIEEIAQSNPDKAAAFNFGQSLEDQAEAIARSAAYDGEHHEGGFMAAVIGGLWGSRRDPLFLGSLFAGPGLSTAKSAMAQIGWGAIKQGLFNAGLQAVAQPAVQDWRRDIGERNGVVPAIENVGMAFVFGAIPGAAIEGVRVVNAGGKAAIGRIVDGTATPDDVRTAADALGVRIDDATDREIRTAGADAANDAAGIGNPLPGVPAEQHATIAAQAVRHAEDPANNPPPEIPAIAPRRRPSQARVIDEALPAQLGDKETVDGKPVTFERFNPQDLTTDAAAFQYKGGGDAAGVTDRLRHVTRWDPLASGKTLVFERIDGARVIADGHQRLGLAKRLGTEDASVKLDGFLFREGDGWTPADVRAIAAKKNMQEGSGDAIDAARVLRDRPDLLDGALPVSSPMMKSAIALARLSDEAFGMAINGVVPPNYAAAVGAMVPDRLQHAGVMADLVRFAPETEREARLLIGEILSAGFRAEEQISLFGAAPAARSLISERVKVLDAAMVGLNRDKKLFGTLADKADAIEAAGNQLARDTNDARARDAVQLQDMLTRLARRTGPVSDALNRAAAQMADGAKAGQAAETFLDDVRALLDRDGLAGLLADPELKPAAVVEPGTADALAAAEAASASRNGAPSPGSPQSQQRAIREQDIVSRIDRNASPEEKVRQLQQLTAENRPIIAALLDRIDRQFGTESKSNEKLPENIIAKSTRPSILARKPWFNVEHVRDSFRFKTVLEDFRALPDIVALLEADGIEIVKRDVSKLLTPEIWGWRIVSFDLRMRNGQIVEYYLPVRELEAAKKAGGHLLFENWRNADPAKLSPGQAAAMAADMQRSRDLYQTAWDAFMLRSGASENEVRAALNRVSTSERSVMTEKPSFSSPTVRDNGDHLPATRIAENLDDRSTTNTVEGSSRSTNASASDITANIPAARADDNTGNPEQSLLPGLAPVTVKDQLAVEANRPLRGGDAPAGGLFDETQTRQIDLIEAIAVASRDDGRDVRFISRDEALAEANKPGEHADIVASCKS